MPLIIIPAICKEKGGPFGDPESCQKYGMGYVALSMAVSFSLSLLLRGFIGMCNDNLYVYQMGSVYIWTYIYNLMRVLSRSPIETTQSSIESNYDSYKVPLISSKEEDNQKVSSL